MSHAERRETDRRRWLPATIFVLAFCARLAFQAGFVGMRTPPQDDASQYDWIAWSLASGGPYLAADGLRSHRAPGYTFLLAAVYAMFGHSWAAARVAQALIGAATCLVIGRLGSRLFPGSIGWAAALVYAVDPYAIYFCGYLLSEPLCVLLTAASLLALVRTSGGERGREGVWSCLCALATLTRPNMGLMLPLGLVWLLRRPKIGFRRCALAVAVFCLTLLPWTVRNYSIHGRFVPVTTTGGYNLWLWNNPQIAADPWYRHHASFPLRPLEGERGHGLSEVEVDAAYTRMALTSIRQHWDDMPRLMLSKFLALWSVRPDLPTRGQRRIASVRMIVVNVLFIIGLWFCWKAGDRRGLILLIPVLAVTWTALLYWGDGRVRAPAEPAILLVAVYAGSELVNRARRLPAA